MTIEADFKKYIQSKKDEDETRKLSSEGLHQTFGKLQERIRSGETTGNDILDHSITTTTLLPDANETIEHKFQQLSELKKNLQRHNGEFVLVITKEWERAIMAGRSGSLMKTTFYIGIIKEPFLEMYSGVGSNFGISTEKHVVTDSYYREHPSVYEGSIKSWDISSYWLGRPIGEMPIKHEEVGCFPSGRRHWEEEREKEPKLEIFVGDEAVSNWFIKGNGLLFFHKLQSLLGRTISLPQKFQNKVDTEIQNQKLVILQEIDKLTKIEKIWAGKLAELGEIKLPRISFPLDDASYERTVREDEEDIRRIRSAPIKDEIKKTKASIQHAIQQAIELEMHKDPWVIVEEQTPGKKTEIDVPKLIRGYAKYYEIPIPQETDHTQ